MKNIYLLLILLTMFTKLQAATITSNGTGGGIWSSTSTWNGGIVPTTSDDVVIAASDAVMLTGNAAVLSVEIKDLATLTVQAKLVITSTGANSLKFSGGAGNVAILTITDANADTVSVAGSVAMGAAAGTRGLILMKNAGHILEVQGDLNCSTPGGLDMQTGTIVKLTGSATAGIINGTAATNLYALEIGDGTLAKTVNLPTTGGPIRFYDNGHIDVKNVGTLNCNGTTTLNALIPGMGANVAMNILNGGKVYNGTAALGTNNDVFINIPKLSSLADFKLVTGSLYLYSHTNVSSTTTFHIPQGTIGNLVFGATQAVCNWLVYTNGTGVRSIRIVGDFTASGLPFNGAYAVFSHKGSTTVADAPNVTWEFAGTGKSINYDRRESFQLSNPANPTTTPKILISGNYQLNPEFGDVGTGATLYMGDVTIAPGISLTAKAGLSGIIGSYGIYTYGNLQIGAGSVFDVTASPYSYFQGSGLASSTMSGAGMLKVPSFGQNGVVTSTLSNILIKPTGAYVWGLLGTANFTQTAGTITLDNSTASSYFRLGGGSSTVHTLNNLAVASNTVLDNDYNLSSLKITGDVSFGSGAKFRTNTSATASSTGIIEFGGTTPQTFSADATPGAVIFQKLKINNPAGITISSGTLTVGKDQGSITTQTLDLTAGKINTTSTANLVILPTATITNASSNSYVSGPMRMYASWKSPATSTVQSTTSLQFPTGKSSRLQQIALTGVSGASTNPSLGTGDYVDAEYFSTSYGSNTTVTSSNSPAMIATSYKEYWNLSPSTTAVSGKVKLFWADNYNSAIFNKGSDYLRIAHWTGSTWNDEGNDIGTASVAPGTSGSIQSANTLTSFSPFTFGTTSAAGVPLLIKFITLSAIAKGGQNEISWQVGDETAIACYSVEHSSDGRQFAPIAGQPAQHKASYTYTDATPSETGNYYRIRAFGKDGSAGISNTVHISAGNVQPAINAFPNPITDELNIILSEHASGNVQLTNATGSILLEAPLTAGKARLNTTELAPGLYFISYGNGGETVRLRVVKR